MKIKKPLAAFAVFFALLFSFARAAVPSPTNEFYVNDFANVLSEDTEKFIMDNSVALNQSTKAQIVVSTVESLDGKDLDSYSLEMARSYGIGDKKQNNGVLILLAPNERKVKIEVGYGLEGAINDAKAGRILDVCAVPHFKNDEWDEGIKETYKSVLAETYKEYGMEVPEEVGDYRAVDDTSEDDAVALILGIIIVILIIMAMFGKGPLVWMCGSCGGTTGSGGTGGYTGGGGFYGGGGFGGGGFSGGGGGGFSGGGGSFGGGGAGRGF